MYLVVGLAANGSCDCNHGYDDDDSLCWSFVSI